MNTIDILPPFLVKYMQMIGVLIDSELGSDISLKGDDTGLVCCNLNSAYEGCYGIC